MWVNAGEDGSSPLGLLISFVVGTIGGDGQEKAWIQVMEAHPGLYKLHSEACLHRWGKFAIQQMGPCDFHDHEDRPTKEKAAESRTFQEGCPFLEQDCCWPQDMVDDCEDVYGIARTETALSKEEW